MKKYSIKDIERFSGIKAHTLRSWENRYDILQPERDDNNNRLYSEEQLKHVLNISLLLSKGLSISQIKELTPSEFVTKVNEISDLNGTHKGNQLEVKINALVLSMLEFDESRFEKVLASCLLQRSFENTLREVIYPFLNRIGIMWRTGEISTAKEHFIYQLIRQKIIVAIDGLGQVPPSSERYLLFLPKSEFQDLLILMYMYVLKSKGKSCIYLGEDIPFDDLKEASHIVRPDALFTVIKAPASKIDTQAYVYQLSEAFTEQQILLAGNPYFMEDLEYPKNVQRIVQIDDLKPLISLDTGL